MHLSFNAHLFTHIMCTYPHLLVVHTHTHTHTHTVVYIVCLMVFNLITLYQISLLQYLSTHTHTHTHTHMHTHPQAYRIFNTYVGDHMRTVVLSAVVDEIRSQQLLSLVRETGTVLLNGLQKLEVSAWNPVGFMEHVQMKY